MYKERSRSNRIRRGQGPEHPLYKDESWRQAKTINLIYPWLFSLLNLCLLDPLQQCRLAIFFERIPYLTLFKNVIPYLALEKFFFRI